MMRINSNRKHFTALITAGIVLILATAVFAASWISRANMLRKRGEFGNFVYNNEIYIMGGIHDHTSGPAQIEKYNPSTNKWTHVGNMSFQRHHFTLGAARYGDEVWVCGGKLNNRSFTKRVDVYNVKNNTWRRGPDLPAVHWGGPTVVAGDELHVMAGGGSTNSATTDHHYVLNLKNESAGWKSEPKVPKPRIHLAGVYLNGKIYLVGGEYHHTHDGDTRAMQVYDPSTDTWDTGKAEIPEGRSHHEWATFVHNGEIWSVSGVDSKKSPRGQATIYTYNPGTNRWTRQQDLWAKLVSPGAKIINNTLVVCGGGVNDWFDGTMVTTRTLSLGAPAPTYTLTVTNGTGDGNYEAGTIVNVTADAAPSGQAFDKWTGDVSGLSSTTSATATYTIGTSAVTITASYKDVPDGQYAYGGTPHAVPGRIEAEHFDEGGQGVAWYDNSTGNRTGLLRDTDVDIYTTTDGTNQYKVGYNAGDEWVEYTVNAQAGTYTLKLRVSTPKTDGTAPITINGVKAGTLTIPNTGDWDAFTTIELKNVRVSGGEQVIKIEILGSGWDFNWFEMELSNPVPVELASFKSSVSAGDVTLNWETASENGCLGFNILRSSSENGMYAKINSTIIAGAGTTAQKQYYSWKDTDPGNGTWYYKLEQVDVNGTKNYSDVISATINVSAIHTTFAGHKVPVSVYSRSGMLRIAAGSDLAGVAVCDQQGRRVQAKADVSGSTIIYRSLVPGIYFVAVRGTGQIIKTIVTP